MVIISLFMYIAGFIFSSSYFTNTKGNHTDVSCIWLMILYYSRKAKITWKLHPGDMAEVEGGSGGYTEQHFNKIQSGGALPGTVALLCWHLDCFSQKLIVKGEIWPISTCNVLYCSLCPWLRRHISLFSLPFPRSWLDTGAWVCLHSCLK